MKCLILAAGFGSRLRGVSQSKPLTPVAGVPLIEHVIARAAQGGASEFRVATGHEGATLETFLAELAARSALAITPVRCQDWDCANGHSVVAGAAGLDEPFLLMMSDHLFDPGMVRDLIASADADAGVTLAVDRNVSTDLLDIDDATKVQVSADGQILAIGKTLASYNAIDTGLFLATPALPAAIQAVVAEGGAGSLSDGVQRLAAEGRARTLDVGSARWIDVDSPAMLELAEGFLQAA